MNFFEKVKTVLTDPDAFFENVKTEPLSSAVQYYFVLSFIGTALSFLIISDELTQINKALVLVGINAQGYELFAGIVVFGFAMSFISAGVTQIFAKLLKGCGTYSDTYKAVTYGATPSGLLAWIPLIGLLSSFWAIYLQIKGLSKLHNVSMLRGLAIALLPGIMIVIITFLLIFIWIDMIDFKY